MKKLVALVGLVGACSAAALAEEPKLAGEKPSVAPHLQPLQRGPFVPVLRMARIGPDYRLKSPWYEVDNSGGIAQLCGQDPAFDEFEGARSATGGAADPATPSDGDDPPNGCEGYDPFCDIAATGDCAAGGGYRFFFGSGFQAPMIVNDMVVEPGTEGGFSDRVQFAWYWSVGGPTTSEQCFIAVFTAEDFSDNCLDPASSNGFDGVVFDFGVLGSGRGYYWTDAELCLSGLFVDHPVDGAGAYTLIAAKDYDPVAGTFTPPTGAQFMLWGLKADSPGEEPSDVVYVDTERPFLEIDPVLECNFFGPGFVSCPTDNLGHMFDMFTGAPPPTCVGFICGDTNCDGLFNSGDIDPFFVALGEPALWEGTYPLCDLLCAADINGDGAVNGGDIDRFFLALAGLRPCDSGGG